MSELPPSCLSSILFAVCKISFYFAEHRSILHIQQHNHKQFAPEEDCNVEYSDYSSKL